MLKDVIMRVIVLPLIASAMMLLAGCSSDDESPPTGNGNPPTLSGHVQPILTSSCAVAGCHDSGTESGGLVLEAGSAYGELVDVDAETSLGAGKKRVVPGDAAMSHLVERLEASGIDRMPRSPMAPLSAAQIQTIKDWINDGAKDN